MQQRASPSSFEPVSKPVSEPDLYYAKNIYEERFKNALQYNFDYQSPLLFVDQFFSYAFSESELHETSINKWMEECK